MSHVFLSASFLSTNLRKSASAVRQRPPAPPPAVTRPLLQRVWRRRSPTGNQEPPAGQPAGSKASWDEADGGKGREKCRCFSLQNDGKWWVEKEVTTENCRGLPTKTGKDEKTTCPWCIRILDELPLGCAEEPANLRMLPRTTNPQHLHTPKFIAKNLHPPKKMVKHRQRPLSFFFHRSRILLWINTCKFC